MNENPLVSILLLSMNHELFIEQCILSLKEQTYKNIEIIYLDNASNDNTFEIAKKALEQSGISYKIFCNAESKGISKNLNLLLENSLGLYICPLSTDDWLTRDSIEEKVKYFNQHPEFGMVYTSCYYYFDDTKKTLISAKKNKFKEGWILIEILKECFISTTGCIIKRRTFKKVGNFDENSLLEDWDMFIRIAEKFPIGLVNKELAYYRIKNGVNITGNYQYMLKGFDYIVNKFSHYAEIQETKKLINNTKTYHYATMEPSLKTLVFILKNYRFNYFYFKQTGKTVLGILRKPFMVSTVFSKKRISITEV
ncbi:MAG: glycosyltransferase [Bacteroidota bacterium]|nr:glycosyltransferase [Bacteroidota bacterium]